MMLDCSGDVLGHTAFTLPLFQGTVILRSLPAETLFDLTDSDGPNRKYLGYLTRACRSGGEYFITPDQPRNFMVYGVSKMAFSAQAYQKES